ncbi:hypothetical protein B5F82_03710 [Megamonas hypermegale]|nr:hypothetical protein B5F82_03710 [Megamonas hypermegale]
MECVILDTLSSLAKIFVEKIYRIPDYQRGYAWTLKEVEDFWDDLCRLETDKNHYVGVLTLEPAKKEEYEKWIDDVWIIKSKRYQPLHIVDGQQRITTAIILIVTIAKIMKEKNIKYLNYTTREEIYKKYIYEVKEEMKNKTYIFSYECDNPSYEYLITNIYEENLIGKAKENETVYTKNLLKAKQFFYNKLKNLKKEELEEIYTKITQHFLFNIYTITDDIDVYVTFETMNNRGKLLSNLELLKNRLIYISTLFNVDNKEKNRLRRDVNKCWKKIYYILGRSTENILLDDEFLVTHFMLYFTNLFEEKENGDSNIDYYRFGHIESDYLLNKYFVVSKISNGDLVIKDCFNYIESLSTCITFWGDIKNPYTSSYNDDIKEYIDKINFFSMKRKRFFRYIFFNNMRYLNVFLLSCFLACNNNNKLLLKFLKALERYLFVLDFFESDAVDESNIRLVDFKENILKINEKRITIENIIELMNKISEQIISNTDINKQTIKFYNKYGFYDNNKWIVYFLLEYEYSLMKKSKTKILKLNRWDYTKKGVMSIEHIYPRNSHHKEWIDKFKSLTLEQRNKLRNSLGNLVLVSPEKNSKLGNLPFSQKKCNKDNTIGYKYGTYAEIELTDYEDWNMQTIEERGFKLIAFLSERWGIKIGNGKKDDKRKFLGLDFVKNREVQG